MDYATLQVEKRDEHVLLVTLNRPDVLNALNTQMGKDQLDLWTRLAAEPWQVR
jgi:enoyl-CoA hydratase